MHTQTWIVDIKDLKREDAIICLVGNKNDLTEKRCVTKDEAEIFSKEKGFIFQEVSAKSGSNVNNLFYKDIFDEISRKLIVSEDVSEKNERNGRIKFICRWKKSEVR